VPAHSTATRLPIRRWLREALGRDVTWIVILAASFVIALIVSWQRWADPIVDVGREMNQPLRLASGETLYTDVRHIYGPLSPWLHAVLYRLFGPSLTVLFVDGIVSATIVLALVYWLGRQIMGPAATGAATLHVMSVCMFKPAGNYILPYSYNSLHGATLGLITLALLVTAVKRAADSEFSRASSRAFLAAGVVAGLAILAKTEMGFAAMTAGVAAAILAAYPDARRGAIFTFVFCASAAAITLAVYAIVAAGVGWPVLVSDSWLLFYNMPPEIAYFNKQISGVAHPVRSIERMLIATVKVGTLAAIIAVVSSAIGQSRRRRRLHGERPHSQNEASDRVGSRPWRTLALVLGLLVVMSITIGLDRDKGPYLAMPFLLAGFLAALIVKLGRETRVTGARTRQLIVLTVFALASLARMILHVRSGGAYASYVLPVSVVLFTYLWVGPFAGRFRDAYAAGVARTIAVTLIALSAIINGGVLAYRYRSRNTVPIASARGTIIAEPDIAQAFNEALAYIDRHTEPDDAVAVMPEGTSIDFLSGRKNPLREEIITPGYLDAEGEARAIRQLQDAGTALILIPNRPTAEFGPKVFGRDYYRRLMQWIDANYTTCAIFGPAKDPGLEIGDPRYFIRAYCPRDEP
jgi:4-amino-4-deoxy-L-arabinose transferase-like glycosyltransferase